MVVTAAIYRPSPILQDMRREDQLSTKAVAVTATRAESTLFLNGLGANTRHSPGVVSLLTAVPGEKYNQPH